MRCDLKRNLRTEGKDLSTLIEELKQDNFN
jgi:hypothetical protein